MGLLDELPSDARRRLIGVVRHAAIAVLVVLASGQGVAQVGPAAVVTTIDATGNVGEYTSVAIGLDGFGLISYRDTGNRALKVAHCSNTTCTAATLSTLDASGSSGWHTSLTIGSDGLGLISYYDFASRDLKIAHCDNPNCSTATVTPLDQTGGAEGDTSVTTGADSLGLISYYDRTNGDLKVAHCSNVPCTTASLTTVDSTGDVGLHTAVAIGPDGLGLISYYDRSNRDLKVAHCHNPACTSATLSTLDSTADVGLRPSIAIGADGFGLISYWDWTNYDLKVAHCSNTACTAATLTTLDAPWFVGYWSSVTLGPDGLGLISYSDDRNGNLKVAHCVNVTCTAATLTTVDGGGHVVRDTSVTIGADGLPLISYRDEGHSDLKVAHCENPACQPGTTPQPPAGLRLTALSGNTVTIAWTPPATGPTPTGYVLEGGITTGQVLASIPTVSTAPSYTFVAPTGAFYIRVHAVVGPDRSGPSNEIRIFVNIPGPPDVPSNLLGLVNGSTLYLSWTPAAAGGLPTSLMLDVTGSLVVSLGLPVSESFSYVGVPAGTYTFSVRAVNASGASPPSAPVTLAFPGPCAGVPDVPERFAATTNGNTIMVSWAPPASGPAATSYTLLVSGSFVGSFPTTGRSLSGTVASGSYTLAVRAENPCGSGTTTVPETIVIP